MSVACDTTSLMALSKCFNCLDEAQLEAQAAYLMCQWASGGGTAPVAPTDLDIDVSGITADSTTFFTKLTWASAIVPDSFEIWRSEVSGGNVYHLLASVGGAVLTYSDDCRTMAAGDFYTYKVRSKVGAATSTFTNEVQTANGIQILLDGTAVNLSYPLLKLLVFDVLIDSCNNLISVAFPALKRIATDLYVTNNPVCTSVTIPAMQSIGFPPVFDGLHLDGNNFATLDLSSLATIQCDDGFSAGSNTNLVSVAFNAAPNWIDDGTGISAIFDLCALNAATVNRILAIGVANGWTSAFIKLDGGTNAAPSGQGILDAATLTGNGCTVITN